MLETKEKIPEVTQEFISPRNFCPYCGAAKERGQKLCTCGESVVHIHTVKRPFHLIKPEIFLLLLTCLFMGPSTIPFVIILMVVFLIMPVLLMRNRNFPTIATQVEALKNQKKEIPEAKEPPVEESGNSSNKEEEIPDESPRT